ncbi:MAG: methyl-accepting chemotaxis protein [Azorhizobium sp. 32-67-21]|nr:MAG: methyl-accepting chemotaxis protein [Azorhizobium sp. 32-67-21]
MTAAFFDYPNAAAFGRVVPKSRIYEHAGVGTALRDLFVTQVDQIVWKYKLAPETMNLAATKAVSEIQVFGISLRSGEIDEEVLRAIDRAIPFPLIFELGWSGKRRAVAAFKRSSDADSAKWVVSAYFATDWTPDDAPRRPLPVALNLGGLYEALITALMPEAASDEEQASEDIQARVARMEAIRTKVREVDRIKARLTREKQFNKRVAINAELRAARHELERLSGGRSCQCRDE